MVNAYTATSTNAAAYIKAVVDRYAEIALRNAPCLREIADKRPVQVEMPGSSVTFYIQGDLAPVTAALNEIVDPDSVQAPAPTTVTLTPAEYGNLVISTRLVNDFAFTNIDAQIVGQVAYNMRDSLDGLVATELHNIAATVDILNATTNYIQAQDVRFAVKTLRKNAAQPRVGELYGCYLHPDTALDIRTETNATNWFEGHKYDAPNLFWPGVTGVYEGCYFVETPRLYKTGTGATTVYDTIFVGQQALAEGVVREPSVNINPTVADAFGRKMTYGWYGNLGWKLFRSAASFRYANKASTN